MLVYVALSNDCCGYVFEGIFPTLDAAKDRVRRSPRPEGVEEWEVGPEGTSPIPVRRWDIIGGNGGFVWTEPIPLRVSQYS